MSVDYDYFKILVVDTSFPFSSTSFKKYTPDAYDSMKIVNVCVDCETETLPCVTSLPTISNNAYSYSAPAAFSSLTVSVPFGTGFGYTVTIVVGVCEELSLLNLTLKEAFVFLKPSKYKRNLWF